MRTVRAALKHSGVVYDYVDIRKDNAGRMRVKEINAGNESVPTLVFADGSTLTEPSREILFTHLESLGYDLTPLSTFERILIQLENPLISAFGAGLGIAGWVADALPVVVVGAFLVVLPIVVRIFRK
ncbi:MAG: glutaredoxin domain-containing protein [Anaerolineales bacterium]